MKKIFLSILCLVFLVSANAQKQRPSPAATAEGTINGAKITISYSQPSAKGRKIFGGLEAYGKVWRTGANEATVFETDKAIKVEGKDLAAGKYELFTIPGEKEWVIIFQNYAKQWGAFSYKEENDVLRASVKATKPSAFVETFVINVVGDGVTLEWENTKVHFTIK